MSYAIPLQTQSINPMLPQYSSGFARPIAVPSPMMVQAASPFVVQASGPSSSLQQAEAQVRSLCFNTPTQEVCLSITPLSAAQVINTQLSLAQFGAAIAAGGRASVSGLQTAFNAASPYLQQAGQAALPGLQTAGQSAYSAFVNSIKNAS